MNNRNKHSDIFTTLIVYLIYITSIVCTMLTKYTMKVMFLYAK